MQDILRARYDAISYRHGAIPDSHPARVAVIGRLHGVPTAPPDGCRVLELGCAEGMNLLPLAERLPGSQFLGVDFSRTQIAAAEEARAACGLNNVRFLCSDLLEFEPEPESYDYVIAHGVYSWVPDEVKSRLLAICKQALTPNGVAYVSYNTLPGWGLLSGLREFLLTETAHEQEPLAQIEHARRVLGALSESLSRQQDAYSRVLHQAVTDMLRKKPELLYHDELAPVNDPRTFTAFTAHAANHGLHYLAEAHYATVPFEHVPAPMRSGLAGLGLDFRREQQFMDVMFQRWLRNSLLCRAELPAQRPVNLEVIGECALGLRMRLADSRINLGPGAAMRLVGANDVAVDFVQPAEKALLAALAQAAPARVPFREAVDGANQLLKQVGLPAVENPAELYPVLFRLFTLDGLDLLLLGSGDWLRTGDSPAPSALMRYQVQHGLSVTNRWHEPVALTAEGQQWLLDPSSRPSEAALRAGLLV